MNAAKLTAYGLLTMLLTFPAKAALPIGADVPDVTVTATDGEPVSLPALKGKWVVLFFYPKADTPGCTKQSCSMRDGYQTLQDLDAVVLGASLDDLDSQKAFQAKYELPYRLLADPDKALAKAFDVVGLAGAFAQRKTFLINPAGKIAYVFDKVDVSNHDDEVAAKLRELQAQ